MKLSLSSRARIEAALLEELQGQPLTFAELQQSANASSPTVRLVLKKLIGNGLVSIIGSQKSTGGRPANIYALTADAKIIVGVHLELPGLHLVASNLAGEIFRHEYISRAYDIDPNDAVREIVRFTQEITDSHGIDQMLGIGIAAPGFRDPSGAILAIGRDPAWQNVPLAKRLQQETNLLVLVQNDVDCMAQAELELDSTIGFDDFLYFGFTEGVKASLMLGGEIFSGPFGNAGSIGHTTVAPDGPLCTCGNRGCLETVASVRAILPLIEQRIELEPKVSDRLISCVAIDDRMDRFHAFLDAAADGEPLSLEIIQQALDYLAIAIANLVNIFQVKMVIVGGEFSQLAQSLQDYLDMAVRARLIPILNNNLTIRYAKDGRDYKAALGAAHRFVKGHLIDFVQQDVVLK